MGPVHHQMGKRHRSHPMNIFRRSQTHPISMECPLQVTYPYPKSTRKETIYIDLQMLCLQPLTLHLRIYPQCPILIRINPHCLILIPKRYKAPMDMKVHNITNCTRLLHTTAFNQRQHHLRTYPHNMHSPPANIISTHHQNT